MLKKIIVLTILIFGLFGCGYSSIYSNNKTYDFSISKFEVKGNPQINSYINYELKKFANVKKNKEYELYINTDLNKITLAKDLKGNTTNIKIIASLNLIIIDKDKVKKQVSFSESFTIKEKNSSYEQNNYEKIIINDLSEILFNRIIFQLSKFQ